MDENTEKLSYATAIHQALAVALEKDPNVIVFGLGTDDPKGVFGTTLNLHRRFGGDRVFDMPTSENAMTGMAIGAALNGIRPVLTHQRLDFALLSLDQLINNAAKWHYMFGGKRSVGVTVRMILGRGWGQGPTHSQNLQALFAHIPGLKVVMPAFPDDAKGLLLSAIFDGNPVIFLEHRWCHAVQGEVTKGDHRVPIGKAKILRSGSDITLVSMSYMTIEALHACEHLAAVGVQPELIDLRSIVPMDWDTIAQSVRKTGRLLVLDTATEFGSVAGEIIAHVTTHFFELLKGAPRRIALPDFPTPTSPSLTKAFYPGAEDIVRCVGEMLKKNTAPHEIEKKRRVPHDVPGEWFKGPF